MEVAVIGTGYVGLTTAACLAYLGHDVVGADASAEKVEALGRGVIPIVEERLDEIVAAGLGSGRLRFTTSNVEAAAAAEVVFLCLPTPMGEGGSADMSYVRAVAAEIGPHLRPGATVVNKSTVPVGSAGLVGDTLGRADVCVVSNPEFLREGTSVNDFLHPDRIVIGADDDEAATALIKLYDGLDAPVVVTDLTSAETIKYASNAFLATKLSFVNAMAELCESVGADATAVMHGMGLDRRIGLEFLRPGPGWGGSCFPKDTRALLRIADGAGYDFSLLRGVIAANDEQFDRVAAKVAGLVGGDLTGVRVAVWGLTFKAGTDDLRESPALEVVRRLLAAGAEVTAYDPTRPVVDGVEVADDPYSASRDASVLVVLTEWPEFARPDFGLLRSMMDRPAIVDTRNVMEPAVVVDSGFTYASLGRKTRRP